MTDTQPITYLEPIVKGEWYEHTCCTNCGHVIVAKKLFGQKCKCPKCGHSWIATWAQSMEPVFDLADYWHLSALYEFYVNPPEPPELPAVIVQTRMSEFV